MLFEVSDKLSDGLSLPIYIIIVGMEEANEDPLCPLVILRIRGAEFTRPIKAESNTLKLFTIATNVLLRRYLGMLSCLDGILLCG